ncbi:MAG TPA: RNA polymerase factor sigma-54 [Bacteroidales bacterium]|jgi:RNA polymerase sigma-54 factor|nr:RNA polymerase factor sigma-54 [Bacteroidales bacterium]HPB89024.1 RNA polymerase factor sigma-54 [Bacteroidales bacterium]HPY21860.1 RNA polymerase factor sigma-54 [Bacteroidales bacterium]HQA93457.1 RNA polymerase factor sigma-54 [Bacteroidales bacterium]HQN24003.1 RNA polymerase factor sigma-54 [Bacteroidales bacterium]
MLKQTLQQTQTTKLSPLQIQTIKLLELPMLELEQKIQREIEENPVLDEVIPESEEEETANVALDSYDRDDPTPSYKLHVNNQGKDLKPQYNTFSVQESFHQNLIKQLGFCSLDERKRQIATFMIGMLEDDGYLRRDLDSLTDDIAFRLGIETTEDELEEILFIIQEFEPVGVGARDLRECLLLQIAAKNQTPSQQLAETILRDYFNEFSRKHYPKIMSRLGISSDELKEAIEEIQRLNPRPGGQIDDSYSEQTQQVIPDFILELRDGELVMSMPRYSIPELRVNRRYADMLIKGSNANTKAGKEAVTFVKKKLDDAKWFIEAIKQRQNTLQNTMNAIIDFQREYFMEGDETKLKPMVLRNIAEKANLDISTISRVVNCKYIQTHFGIFPLKYFFSEGLLNEDGEEVSTREIKNVLVRIIDNEDKTSPLTDESIVEALSEKGYKVARRTVAKYRDQLGIPVAKQRVELL